MLWDLQWVGVGVEAAWLTSGDYDGQGALREREIESAMDVIGVPAKRRHLLRLPDGRLMDFLAEGIKVIGVLLDRVRPDHVFTTAFEGGHADHDSANFLVAEALRRRASNTTLYEFPCYNSSGGQETRGLRTNGFPPGSEGVAVHRISSEAAKRKRAMLEAYASQAAVFEMLGFSFNLHRIQERGEPFRLCPPKRDRFNAAP